MKIPLYSTFFALGLLCSTALSQTCDKLVITGPPSGPPSSWIENGELIGASVDFVKNIALAAGVKSVDVRSYDTWPEALQAAHHGDVDLIFSATWSQDRTRYLNFIQPSYSGQFLYAITKKGNEFPLRKYDDLKGRKGITSQGETYGNSQFGSFVHSELALASSPSIADSLKLLLEGKVDYILAYENAANSEIFKQNLNDKVTINSTFPFYADRFIALSKRFKCSETLAPLLSKQIEIAQQKNLYYALTLKFTNAFLNSFALRN